MALCRMARVRLRALSAVGAAVVAVTLVVFLAPGCKRPGAAPGAAKGGEEEKAVPVETARAVRDTVKRTIEVTGTIQAEDDVNVASVTTARIEWMIGKEGTRVSAGQPVVRLDSKDTRANLAQAQAQLKAAEARLVQAKKTVGLTDATAGSGVEQAQQAVETARARLQQAELNQSLIEKQTNEAIAQAQTALVVAQASARQAEEAIPQTTEATEASIAQAEAAIGAAEAQLADLKRGARSQQRRQAEEAVNQAQLNVDNAQRELGRLKKLKEAGAVSQSTVDAAQLSYDVASSQLASAKQALSLTEEGPTAEQIQAAAQNVAAAKSARDALLANRRLYTQRQEDLNKARQAVAQAESAVRVAEANRTQVDSAAREVLAARAALATAESGLRLSEASRVRVNISEDDVSAAQASVDAARAAVSMLEVELSKRTITSPVSGVVAQRMADPGEVANFGQALVRIVTSQILKFEATVSELEIGQVIPGMPVEVTVDGVPGRTFEGKVLTLHPAGDAQSRNFVVEVSVPRDDKIKPGMFASGLVPVEVAENAVAIPKDALVEVKDGYKVFVVEADVAKERKVVLGLQNRNRVVVLQGVNAGDEVVVSGQASLSDGTPIKRADLSASSSPAAPGEATPSAEAPGGAAEAASAGGPGAPKAKEEGR